MEYLRAIAVFPAILLVLTVLLMVAEYLLVNYGQCRIDINEQEQITVTGGDSLLSALYENKIFIPSACGGQATCGYCKVKVLSGADRILPTELPFMSRAEIRDGVRLACVVKVKQDMAIRIPEQYLHVQEYTAEVISTRNVTHDIKEIRLKLVEPPRMEFEPGQYIQVKAPDGYGGHVYRAYSISSPVSASDMIELIVRLVPGGIGSTYLHNLKVGDNVTLTGPFGEFELSHEPDRTLVCVGGGCGMAPIKSIIYTIYERDPNRNCWFFFGCRGPEDIFYLDEFKELEKRHPGFRVVYALSDLKPGDQWDGEKGFIHLSVDKYFENTGKTQAFLCGPPPMIEAVMEVLEDKGVEEEDIFYDKF